LVKSVATEKLACDTDWIQNDEEIVSKVTKILLKSLELVEWIPYAFGNRPGQTHHKDVNVVCGVVPYPWHNERENHYSRQHLLNYSEWVVRCKFEDSENKVETLSELSYLQAFLPAFR